MPADNASRPVASAGAWLVHAYTAAGAVLAFLATQAAVADDFRTSFLWLSAALLIDSTDGLLARWQRVHERLPGVSGQKLDDIVDYLTYVFVPAIVVWKAELLPPTAALPVVSAMLLSSAYGFVSADAKSADHFFTGFPSYWNIVALYLVALGLPRPVNAGILLMLSVLVFVRIGYIYPTRTETGRTATIALGLLWGVLMLALVLQLPAPYKPLAWASLFFPIYYAILSFVLHTRRSR